MFYHIIVYMCHCSLNNIFQVVSDKFKTAKRSEQLSNDIRLFAIPERSFNYNEYQDGLISDDFKM